MLRWPLDEALIAFEAKRRREDLEQFRHEQLLHAQGALKGQPRLPRTLAEDEPQHEAEPGTNW